MSQTFRLGLFIVATMAAVAVGVFLIGDRESKFSSHYRVNADFDNVAGLAEGADVRVGGIRKGTIRSIKLPTRPGDKLVVAMDLTRDTRPLVKQDSVASIKSEGLLGDKYMEVSFGSEGLPQLKDGETIQSAKPLDIGDLMGKANGLLDGAKGAIDNLQGATANIQTITAKINGGTGTMGALVNDRTMYTQATQGMAALKDDAEALKHNFLLRGFFKKRGYEDASDLTQNQIAELPSRQPSRTFSYDIQQAFDKPDSAKLKKEKSLDEIGRYLQGRKFSIVVITASAGAIGDSQKQQTLTEAQAGVVRKYLVDHFALDDKRIKTLGLGKSDDVNDVPKLQVLVYNETPAAPPRKQAQK
jgi:phospholipid/cholesterol/gamma-HCH transport system substrate-binding protein